MLVPMPAPMQVTGRGLGGTAGGWGAAGGLQDPDVGFVPSVQWACPEWGVSCHSKTPIHHISTSAAPSPQPHLANPPSLCAEVRGVHGTTETGLVAGGGGVARAGGTLRC